MNTPPVQTGDILARKYRVDRVLGAGNMGIVVAATHVDLGQVVAVKHMLPSNAASSEQRERFLREARAAVRLKSHHVARVLDVGADADETPYIVMEFLEGQDLDALLKARGPRPFAEAVEYVLQVCEAVGEAHAVGIVHRDLKPANLFLTYDVSGAPCVKVLDFGISKLAGADLALTNESQALGSPLYMSPEQMNSSKSVDARSDMWALGIILYQLVAGLTPFHSETIQELCVRVLTGQPTPLEQHRPDAPPGFEEVILRCLERDRERRFRDVAELAAALSLYAPAHARVYAERVARVVHMRGAPTGSSPDRQTSPVSRPPVPSEPDATAPLPPSPLPLVVGVASPTQPFPAALPLLPAAPEASPPTPPLPTVPKAFPPIAPSVPTVGGDTGLTLSATSNAASSLNQKRGSRARALLIFLVAVLTLAIPVASFVVFGKGGPSVEQALAPSSTLAATVTTTGSPALLGSSVIADPSSAAFPSPLNSTGIAGDTPTGSPGAPASTSSATAPVSSASALPPRTVKPSGSKPKAPPVKDLYSR